MLNKLLHRLGWHSMVIIGWTVMGNPIEKCSLCDHYTYTIGSMTMKISKQQAHDVMTEGEKEDRWLRGQ